MTMEPTDRELERGIEKVRGEPSEVDEAEVWEAYLNATHPREMDTDAEANALRRFWAISADRDPENMSPEEIQEFDREIRDAISTDPQ